MSEDFFSTAGAKLDVEIGGCQSQRTCIEEADAKSVAGEDALHKSDLA